MLQENGMSILKLTMTMARPFWISPRQILVVPVAELYNEYAEEVRQLIHNEGFYVDSDLSDKKMQKKIRGN